MFWMHLWRNITFCVYLWSLHLFITAFENLWELKPLILANLYYHPIYCCICRSWQVFIFLLVDFVVKKGRNVLRHIHTYQVIRINNIIVPCSWTSHVVNVFQYIERKYIFSINIYFCKHSEHFWLAWFFDVILHLFNFYIF